MQLLHHTLVLAAILTCGTCYQNPSMKAWWAKRVLSDDFYTAGRLTARQIKYAAESDYKSLLSFLNYENGDGVEQEQGAYLPSTEKARQVAVSAGIEYNTVTDFITDLKIWEWASLENLDRITKLIPTMEKPMVFYCLDSYVATFFLLLYFAQETKASNQDVPQVSAEEVFEVGAQLGFNYDVTNLVEMVENVTGVFVAEPAHPNVAIEKWYMDFWHAKPVYGNWFTCGQFESTDLESLIVGGGYKTVMNHRKGVTTLGEPSQEQVTLLNVKDEPTTYAGEGRQSVTELLKNRLDPSKPNTYISSTSTINYESRNPIEFGDDIGNNETLERIAVESFSDNITYVHLPIGGEFKYSKALWEEYKDEAEAANSRGPVLAHCRDAFRGMVIAVMNTATTHNKDSKWVIQRLRQIGFDAELKDPTAVAMFREVLDKKKVDDGKDGAAGIWGYQQQIWTTLLTLSLVVVVNMANW